MYYSPKEHIINFSILYFKGLLIDKAPPTAEFVGRNFMYATVHIKDYSVGMYVYIHIVYIYLYS
jgi:hypothetical protein